MEVAIILYDYCSLWASVGPMEMLLRANKYCEYHGLKNGNDFNISFLSVDGKQVQTTYPLPVQVSLSIKTDKQFDLIIVPGFDSHFDDIINNSAEITEWLKHKHQQGVHLASICTGAFFLAQTGLLNGKSITTHWLMEEFFKNSYPEIKTEIDKVMIHHGDITIGGTATTHHNLILFLIELYMGRKVAISVSKTYLIDWNRDRPDSYKNLVDEKPHNDDDIHSAQKFIKKNVGKKLKLEDIACSVAMNKRTFIRRFRKATNETPLTYIHKVKVEKAKEILESERKTFEEIAYGLGYEDANAFRKIFVRQVGISPMKYKARYQIGK